MIILVPIDRINPNPWQTRFGDPDPEYIKALALDIAANGLLQSPAGRMVTPDGRRIDSATHDSGELTEILVDLDNRVQLAFGHHRLTAYRWLNDVKNTSNLEGDYSSIPVELAPYTDEQMAILAWSENEKRRDVTPIERARAIQQRMDSFGWTQIQVAEKLGVSRPVVSNALRLLGLPDEIQASLADGTISERVGLALVAYLDMPEEIKMKIDAGYNHVNRWDTILQDALSGQITSDVIRKRINMIFDTYGRKLDESVFGLDTMQADSEIRSATCRDCTDRLKDRNICPMVACYDRKTWLFEQSYLERASEVSGITPLTIQKSDYELTTFNRWTHEKALPAVLAAKCENLRLKYDGSGSEGPDRVESFPNARIVCVKNDRFCTCVKGAEQALQDSPQEAITRIAQSFPDGYSYTPPPGVELSYTTEELSGLAVQAKLRKQENLVIARELTNIAGERIADGLARYTLNTWKMLANNIDYGLGMDLESVLDIQQAIGKKIADANLPWDPSNIDVVLKELNDLLADCNLALLDDPRPPVAPNDKVAPAGKLLVDVFDEDDTESEEEK